jgi:hypothetical protein
MAGECLTEMVLSAKKNDLFEGLAADLSPTGIAILQYMDGTILCIDHDPEKSY